MLKIAKNQISNITLTVYTHEARDALEKLMNGSPGSRHVLISTIKVGNALRIATAYLGGLEFSLAVRTP